MKRGRVILCPRPRTRCARDSRGVRKPGGVEISARQGNAKRSSPPKTSAPCGHIHVVRQPPGHARFSSSVPVLGRFRCVMSSGSGRDSPRRRPHRCLADRRDLRRRSVMPSPNSQNGPASTGVDAAHPRRTSDVVSKRTIRCSLPSRSGRWTTPALTCRRRIASRRCQRLVVFDGLRSGIRNGRAVRVDR